MAYLDTHGIFDPKNDEHNQIMQECINKFHSTIAKNKLGDKLFVQGLLLPLGAWVYLSPSKFTQSALLYTASLCYIGYCQYQYTSNHFTEVSELFNWYVESFPEDETDIDDVFLDLVRSAAQAGYSKDKLLEPLEGKLSNLSEQEKDRYTDNVQKPKLHMDEADVDNTWGGGMQQCIRACC